MCEFSGDILKISLLKVAPQHFCFFTFFFSFSSQFALERVISNTNYWRVLLLLKYYSIWLTIDMKWHTRRVSHSFSALVGPMINTTSFTGLDYRLTRVRIQPKMLIRNMSSNPVGASEFLSGLSLQLLLKESLFVNIEHRADTPHHRFSWNLSCNLTLGPHSRK